MGASLRAGRGVVCILGWAVLVAACGGANPHPSDATPSGAGATSPSDGSDGGTGGGGPASAWDAASLDPRIAVSLSTSPACAGIGPRDRAPAPTRVVRAFAGTKSGCNGGSTSNALGDVAFACISTFPERGWNELFSPGGSPAGAISSWTLAAPTAGGFASTYTAFGQGPTSFEFGWREPSGWQSNADSATTAQRVLFAHPSGGILELWVDAGSGAATRWMDPHGVALTAARDWPGVTSFGPGGVDAAGRALVTYRTGGQSAGPLRARWLERGGTTGEEFALADSATWTGPVEALAGGGLVFGRAFIVASGATAAQLVPVWLAVRAERIAVVNGGRGYAFGKIQGDSPCDPTVRLYARDGTACGTVDLFGPGDSCPQVADVGADGTLIQSIPAGHPDANGAPQTVWRWWPALFQ